MLYECIGLYNKLANTHRVSVFVYCYLPEMTLRHEPHLQQLRTKHKQMSRRTFNNAHLSNTHYC